MGFYFRRSSSFGPFRFNFSKSAAGASFGVKGARVTLSSKGKTYVTVSSGGFYYRQTLSPSTRRSAHEPQSQTVQAQPILDEIRTADVEELLESSKSELVENLNKRAQMFNPAIILFVLASICAVCGVMQLMDTVSRSTLPGLPDSAASRQSNRTDEYALLLARYGQPSAVTIAQAGSVPLRIASYADAHLAAKFVPAGCVDSYAYFEAHKNDTTRNQNLKRRRAPSHATDSGSPPCVLPADKASTVVGYQDTTTDSAIDSGTAERYLAGHIKSSAPPIVKMPDTVPIAKHKAKLTPQLTSVVYNEDTLKGEKDRLAEIDKSSRQSLRISVAFLTCALLLLIPGVLVHRRNRQKRTTQLVYELDGNASAQQHLLDQSLEQLTRSRMIWRLDSQSAVSDWKRNAGASYNVKRKQISVLRAVPPRIESNVVPICIDLDKLKMFFLPDQVLYWQHGTFASIEYKDLNFQASSTRFIEDQVQTSDSQQVGSTWRYVRKDGGPDRRFNDNRQLPVMLYGLVTAVSSGGLNLMLHTSNVAAASSFATSFRNFQNCRDRHLFEDVQQIDKEGKTEEKRQPNRSCPENIEKAMTLLGVKTGITLEQLAMAYRHMAQMYHPDKVAGLGPEFQKLAEERMKEINVSHQVVRQYLERA